MRPEVFDAFVMVFAGLLGGTLLGLLLAARLMPPLHTTESVLREIAEGLENGTVVLGNEPEEQAMDAAEKQKPDVYYAVYWSHGDSRQWLLYTTTSAHTYGLAPKLFDVREVAERFAAELVADGNQLQPGDPTARARVVEVAITPPEA